LQQLYFHPVVLHYRQLLHLLHHQLVLLLYHLLLLRLLSQLLLLLQLCLLPLYSPPALLVSPHLLLMSGYAYPALEHVSVSVTSSLVEHDFEQDSLQPLLSPVKQDKF